MSSLSSVERTRTDQTHQIDVLVVTYNSASHVAAALSALKAQTGVAIRLFVQDNGSVDDTEEVVRSVAARLGIPLDTTVDRSNPGFATAVNHLIGKSSSDLVLVLNPDTGATSKTVPATLGLLCGIALQPGVGIVSPKLETSDGTMDRACMRREPTLLRSACTFASRLAGLGWLARWGYNLPEPSAGPLEVDAVNGAFMLVERAKIERVGLMDERYWMYAEDLDWCRAFRSAGYVNICAADLVWQHVKGGSEEGRRGSRTQMAFLTAMSSYYEKFYPGLRHLPGRVLVRTIVLAATGYYRRQSAKPNE